MTLKKTIGLFAILIAIIYSIWGFIEKPESFDYDEYIIREWRHEYWCIKKSLYSQYIGKLDGIVYANHPNGLQKFIIPFSDGVPNGKATYFHENGNIQLKGSFLYGRKVGKWIKYNKNEQALYEFRHINESYWAKFLDLSETSKRVFDKDGVFNPNAKTHWIEEFTKYNYNDRGQLISKGLYRTIYGYGLFNSSLFKYHTSDLALFNDTDENTFTLGLNNNAPIHPLENHNYTSPHLAKKKNSKKMLLSSPETCFNTFAYKPDYLIERSKQRLSGKRRQDHFIQLHKKHPAFMKAIKKHVGYPVNKMNEDMFKLSNKQERIRHPILFNDIWLNECIEYYSINNNPSQMGPHNRMSIAEEYLGDKNVFLADKENAWSSKIWVRDSIWNYYHHFNSYKTDDVKGSFKFSTDSTHMKSISYVLGAIKEGDIRVDKSFQTSTINNSGLTLKEIMEQNQESLVKISFKDFVPVVFDMNFSNGLVHYHYKSGQTNKEIGFYESVKPNQLIQSKHLLMTNLNGYLTRLNLDTSYYDHNLIIENKHIKNAFPEKSFSAKLDYIEYHDMAGKIKKLSNIYFKTKDKKGQEILLKQVRSYDYKGKLIGECYYKNGKPFGKAYGYTIVDRSDGRIARYSRTYKPDGSHETKYFYPSGELAISKNSTSKKTLAYLKDGRLTDDLHKLKGDTNTIEGKHGKGGVERPTLWQTFDEDSNQISQTQYTSINFSIRKNRHLVKEHKFFELENIKREISYEIVADKMPFWKDVFSLQQRLNLEFYKEAIATLWTHGQINTTMSFKHNAEHTVFGVNVGSFEKLDLHQMNYPVLTESNFDIKTKLTHYDYGNSEEYIKSTNPIFEVRNKDGLFPYLDLRLGLSEKLNENCFLNFRVNRHIYSLPITSIKLKTRYSSLPNLIWGKDYKKHAQKMWGNRGFSFTDISFLKKQDLHLGKDAVSYKVRFWLRPIYMNRKLEEETVIELFVSNENISDIGKTLAVRDSDWYRSYMIDIPIYIKLTPDSYMPSGLNQPINEVCFDFNNFHFYHNDYE